MTRSIYLFLLIALLAIGAVWLATNPGTVEVAWGGYVVETSLVTLAFFTLILGAIIAILYRVFVWLKTGPGRLGGALSSRRRNRGLEALSNGMVAIAAGDADEARRAAIEAEKYLKGEPMTLLLAAQAAELNEDERATRIYYDRMAERPDTEFMGLRGLIARARTEGNLEAAIDLANRADELKPGTPWVVKELFDLHLKLRHWDEAETVLARMARGKAAKSASVKRTRSVIALERARQALKRDEKAAAFDLALSAHQLDPAFVPASVLAIRLSVPSRKRDKLIAEAWKTNPHPDLIAAIREAKAFEDEAAWLDYVRTMLAPNTPDNRETLMEEARAALAAQKWGEARKYLNRVAEIDPSSSVYRLLAELDEKANADVVAAREWILKSVDAPPDPIWICKACGRQEESWSAHCPSCDGFDTLDWKKPERGHASKADEIEAEIVQELPAPAP